MVMFVVFSLLTLLTLVLLALLLGRASAIARSIGLHTRFPCRVYSAVTHVARSLTIKSDRGSYGNTICIFRYLNRTLACSSTLEASNQWPFKSGLETLSQEREECSGCRRVG